MLVPGTKTTPQLAQLEILFKAPLIKDSVVATKNDLITLDNRFHFIDKMIWVSDEKAFYFLNSGDGSVLIHWSKFITRITIDLYNPLSPYQEKDIVYLAGKIYKAKQNVPEGELPTQSGAYWDIIAGESITYRYLFTATSSVIVYTEIKNPLFEVIIGDLELDTNNDNVIGPDGLISILNQEIIDAHISKRDDLPPSNGFAYEIQFEENMLPVVMSGVINIK